MNRFQVSVVIVAIFGCVSPWLGIFAAFFSIFFFLLSDTPKSTRQEVTIKDLEEAKRLRETDGCVKASEFVKDFEARYHQKILKKIASSTSDGCTVCVGLPTWNKLNQSKYLSAVQDAFGYRIWTVFPGVVEVMF